MGRASRHLLPLEGSSQAKAGKALEVQFEMDTDSKSVPSPMKQIRCTNCAASMEQNQSKCEYCGTNYKKPANSSYNEVLRNEKGEAVKFLNGAFEIPRFMGEPISREDYREKQREFFQKTWTGLSTKEENEMSPNETIGSGAEMPEVNHWKWHYPLALTVLAILYRIIF